MTVIAFPGHKLEHCANAYCNGCMLCHGGLALCVTCGGAEGSMPTDCPGAQMAAIVCDEVYAGELDYRRTEGWIRQPSKMWEGFRKVFS